MGQAHALVNLCILLGPVAIGVAISLAMWAAVVSPFTSSGLALALYGAGVVLFVIAKITVFRSGRLVSFGSRLMSARCRTLYRFSYLLMVSGLVVAIGLLVTQGVGRDARSTSAPARSQQR